MPKIGLLRCVTLYVVVIILLEYVFISILLPLVGDFVFSLQRQALPKVLFYKILLSAISQEKVE